MGSRVPEEAREHLDKALTGIEARYALVRSILGGRELTAEEKELVKKAALDFEEVKQQLRQEQFEKRGELYELALQQRIFDQQKWDGPSSTALRTIEKTATRWVYVDFVEERVVIKTGERGRKPGREILGHGVRELPSWTFLWHTPLDLHRQTEQRTLKKDLEDAFNAPPRWDDVHIFLSAEAARTGVGIKVPTKARGVHVVFADGRILDAHVNHGPQGPRYRARLHDSLYLEIFSPEALEEFEALGAYPLEKPSLRVLPLVPDSETWRILSSRLSGEQLVRPSVISLEGLRDVFRANRGSFMTILAHQAGGTLKARVTSAEKEVPLEIEDVLQLAKEEGVTVFLMACSLGVLRGEGPLNDFALRAMATSLVAAAEAATVQEFFQRLATPRTPLLVGYETVHGAHRAYSARVRVWVESSRGKELMLVAMAMAFLGKDEGDDQARTTATHQPQGPADRPGPEKGQAGSHDEEEVHQGALPCP